MDRSRKITHEFLYCFLYMQMFIYEVHKRVFPSILVVTKMCFYEDHKITFSTENIFSSFINIKNEKSVHLLYTLYLTIIRHVFNMYKGNTNVV